jgi:hypothetical protein
VKRTTISLPDDLAELAQSEARRRGTSVSAVVRGLIEQELAPPKEGPRSVPWIGLFDDPGAPSGADLEEYLADHWADDIDRDRG